MIDNAERIPAHPYQRAAAGTSQQSQSPPACPLVVELVELAAIEVPQEYQRGLKGHRSKIRKNFDVKAVGLLKVGRHPCGRLVIIDGLQRRDVLMSLGHTHWQSEVVELADTVEGAGVFSRVNGKDGRKNLTPAELFRAALAADDQTALAARRAAEAVGLRVRTSGRSKGAEAPPGEISCVTTLQRAVRVMGEDVLRRILSVITRAWPRDSEAMVEVFPAALTLVYNGQHDRIDDDRMVAVLSRHSPRRMREDASAQLGDRRSAMARTIVALYNRRLKSEQRRLSPPARKGGGGSPAAIIDAGGDEE